MKRSLYSRVSALLFAAICASCSSPGQTVQSSSLLDTMKRQDISVGIARGSSSLVTFYAVNNTDSDIRMLTWNTPFEKILSADIFLAFRDGEPLPYLGRKIKRSNPSTDDYLLIPAGQTIQSAMDIAKYYGIAEAGTYTVSINLPNIDGVAMLNQETATTVNTAVLHVVVGQ